MKRRRKNPFPRTRQIPEVFSEAPSSVPYPGEVETPVEASSSPSPAGALPSDSHDSEARTTKAARSSPSNI